MQSRDPRAFLEDMLDCCQKIQRYTAGMSQSSFASDLLTLDATIRNLEIIGEASRYIPEEVRAQLPNIEWRRIVGLRNVLVHAYPMIDDEILWDIVQNNIPLLESDLQRYLEGRDQ